MQDNWFENMEKLAQDLLEQMPKDHHLYVTADRKGRITLPKELGIRPGDVLECEMQDEKIILIPRKGK